MDTFLILIWLLSVFAWSVYDINLRIDKNGIRWYYVFVFFFNFLLMPLLALLEKIYDTNDYAYAFKNWRRKIRNIFI